MPADQWRLASQLGMGARPSFRLIEWPVLRSALPGVAGLVFMLCVTSFTIVLTLGGGPAATTLEVAIYQALRFDFDPARAVALTLGQIVLTVACVWLLSRLGADPARDANLGVAPPRRFVSVAVPERLVNIAVIARDRIVRRRTDRGDRCCPASPRTCCGSSARHRCSAPASPALPSRRCPP